jgi:hypothetical protein
MKLGYISVPLLPSERRHLEEVARLEGRSLGQQIRYAALRVHRPMEPVPVMAGDVAQPTTEEGREHAA